MEGKCVCLLKSTAVKLQFIESNKYGRFAQASILENRERCVLSVLEHYSTGRE